MDARLRAARAAWERERDDPAAWATYRQALQRAGQPWQVAGCQRAGAYRLRRVLGVYPEPTSADPDRRVGALTLHGDALIAATSTGPLRRWGLESECLEPQVTRVLSEATPLTNTQTVFVTSPSGEFLARCHRGYMQVFRRGDEAWRAVFTGLDTHMEGVAISDRGWLAHHPVQSPDLELRRPPIGQTSAYYTLTPYTPHGLAFAEGSDLLLVAGERVQRLRVHEHGEIQRLSSWQPAEPPERLPLCATQGSSYAIAHDDLLAYFQGADSRPSWERLLAASPLHLHAERDGRLRVTDPHGVQWLDSRTGATHEEARVDLSVAEDHVTCAALTPDCTTLAVGTDAGAVLLYERGT